MFSICMKNSTALSVFIGIVLAAGIAGFLTCAGGFDAPWCGIFYGAIAQKDTPESQAPVTNSPEENSDVSDDKEEAVDKNPETMTVKNFFGKKEEAECEETMAVERKIPRTTSPARAALEELLKGPTLLELEQGFVTSINTGVKIEKLTIEDGVARVEFDETLEASVGGSCRVAGIRWQIINTLKQFSTIKEVVISIDGRTEDILQP